MPLNLDSTVNLSIEISAMEISDVFINTDEAKAEATYWKEYVDSEGQEFRVEDNTISLSGSDFSDLIARANEVKDAGNGVYESIKQAVYEKIMDAEGVRGTVE